MAMFYGAGRAGMRLPENQVKNQKCLLIFSERSLDFWLKRGTVSEPGSRRKFDLTDAIAILSLNSFHADDNDTGGDDLEIYHKDSIIRIKEDGNIEMGVDTFKRLINESFADLFNNHVHTVSVAGTPVAQAGVTSSPSKVAGLTPVKIPAVPTTLFLFSDEISSIHMTSKVKVE